MYNTIMLWRSKKLEQNSLAKDDAIIAIKVTDETYKTIRDLKNSSPLMKNVISLKNYEFSKELNEKIANVRAEFDAKADVINQTANDLIDLVSDADNYAAKKALAIAYGVIKEDGRINLD